MPFLSQTRMYELEVKERDYDQLSHDYREKCIELEMLKRNTLTRERLINRRESVTEYVDPQGRLIREESQSIKTMVEPATPTLGDWFNSGPFSMGTNK